jgi:hypothetical protein
VIGAARPIAEIGRRYVRWALAFALAALVVEHTAGIFETTRDFYEAGGLMIVAHGGWARPEWLTGPEYTLTPWGPGYHVAAAAAQRLSPWDDPLVTGRAISLMAGLLTAATIAFAVIQRTAMVEAGLLAAGVFLNYAGISFWIQLFRIDALATLCAIAAYAVQPSGTGLVASAAFVVLGSLVKQTVLLAALPVLIHLVLTGRRHDAIRYAVFVGLGAALAWAAVSFASGGYYFSMGWLANRRTYAIDQAVRLVGDFARHGWTYAAVLALGFAWWSGAIRRCRFALAMVIVWLSAAVMSGVEDASSNFFLESAAIGAIVIGVYGVGALWQRRPDLTSLLLWGTSVAMAISAVSTTGRVIRDRQPLENFAPFRETLSNSSALVDWRYILAALRSGLRPVVNDPFFMTVASRTRAFPIDRLADEVRSGRVAGLVLNGPMPTFGEMPGWPPELAAEFRSHFEPAGIVGGAHIYRFRR